MQKVKIISFFILNFINKFTYNAQNMKNSIYSFIYFREMNLIRQNKQNSINFQNKSNIQSKS